MNNILLKFRRNSIFLFLLLSVAMPLVAQTSREEIFATIEKSGGLYYAYPDKNISAQTPAPKGYKPFYISHYGRHGSRYIINSSDYKRPLNALKKAHKNNALTPLGEDVYQRMKKVWANADGRDGDLSALGAQQHRDIADRMYRNFPEVFSGSAEIYARSTIVPRCILSMAAFCERLKEHNLALHITRESNNRHTRYLGYSSTAMKNYRTDTVWKENYQRIEQLYIRPTRLIASLFTDTTIFSSPITDPVANAEVMTTADFMKNMYAVTSDMQDTEPEISFYDIFTKDELFDMWQWRNLYWYVICGSAPYNHGLPQRDAVPLLANIVDDANAAIKGKGRAADLRFGHDTNLMPLLTLMQMQGCVAKEENFEEVYKVWSDFKLTPKAGNIQMIFFRKNGNDDMIVKFLHNERETLLTAVKSDILPYYHWKDVESFFKKVMDEKKDEI